MFSSSVDAQQLMFPGLNGTPIDLTFIKSNMGATLSTG
jgi:hypothetical protein